MKLVVAEKPSVARDIAAVIGAAEKINGALCGNGYMVTSARGHLVRAKRPEEYDGKYDSWSVSDLPIVPEFEFVPVEGAEDVLERLTMLMNSDDVDEIIEATDAGRGHLCHGRVYFQIHIQLHWLHKACQAPLDFVNDRSFNTSRICGFKAV